MILYKISKGLTVVVEPLSRVINYVGAGVLAVMMFLTATDVILRYVFNRPLKGSFEITSFLMAIVIPFAMAYCAVKKGHISVDILVTRFPKRAQAIVSSIVYLISLGLLSLITWQCFKYVFILYKANTLATTIPIPHWPFVIAVTIGIGVLFLVLLRDFFDYLSQAVGKSQ